MRSRQKPIACALFAVGIVFLLGIWNRGSDAKQGGIDLRSKVWADSESDEGLYVYDLVKESGRRGLSLLSVRKLPLESASGNDRFAWKPLAVFRHVDDIFAPLGFKVMPFPSGDRTLFVLSTPGGGGPGMVFGSVLTLELAGELSKIGTDTTGNRPLDNRIEWNRVRRFRYREAPDPSWYLSDMYSPDLESYRGMLFLAGECDYPGEGGASKGIWVGRVENPSAETVLGSLLGKGIGPALMAFGDRLYCLAVEPNRYHPLGGRSISGRVVAWVSTDGTSWQNAMIPINDPNVAGLGACTYKGLGLIACLSYLPTPNIQIYKFDKSNNSARGISSFNVAKTGEKSLRIQVFKDNPYIFWDEIQGKTGNLLFRRVDVTE